MKTEVALQQVLTELNKAQDKFEPIASPHEGYAVLLEELDELWELVKRDARGTEMRAEAKQVAAMALRFMIDCT